MVASSGRDFSCYSGAERGRIGHDRIAHEGKVRKSALRCLGVAGAASILHDNRDQSEIDAVPVIETSRMGPSASRPEVPASTSSLVYRAPPVQRSIYSSAPQEVPE
jgi:hypothetical protein